MINTNPAADASDAKSKAKPESSAEGTRTQFPTLIHPADLGASMQDVVRFDMHEYVPGELSGQTVGNTGIKGFGFNSGSNNLGPSIGSVTLPIPSGITDQNKADWGSNSMTALDIAKADVAKTAIFDGLAKGVGKFDEYIKKVQEYSGETSDANRKCIRSICCRCRCSSTVGKNNRDGDESQHGTLIQGSNSETILIQV